MLDLPEGVRKQEGKPYRTTEPRPRCAQMSPSWSEKQGEEDREPEEQHGDFSQQSQAYDKPEQEPEPRPIPLEDQQQNQKS